MNSLKSVWADLRAHNDNDVYVRQGQPLWVHRPGDPKSSPLFLLISIILFVLLVVTNWTEIDAVLDIIDAWDGRIRI
jgi:hypothetical protein